MSLDHEQARHGGTEVRDSGSFQAPDVGGF